MGRVRKALIAQLGERQTEEMKALCWIHGQNIPVGYHEAKVLQSHQHAFLLGKG